MEQTSNLNDRSIEIEAKLVEIEQKLTEADTKHGDLITNLVEFGDKQTSDLSASRAASINDISALRANIEMWATGFQGKIESHLGAMASWEACNRALEALEARRRKREAHRWTARK